jgi:hypothetical protein
VHESRNGINLCDSHHSDFDGYRFFIRWVPSVRLNCEIMAVFSYCWQVRVFVFVNFSQNQYLEQFHGKMVALDPNHDHSPFPAPFLIQEMRTRGFHPWCTDRPIPRPLSPTYTLVDDGEGGGVAGFGGGGDIGVGFGGSGSMAGPGRSGGMVGLGGSGGAASYSSGLPSTEINQQYLVLSNPFQDPELLESMRHQWQRLPNWKSATVEELTWEGTAEENARKYVNLVGISNR